MQQPSGGPAVRAREGAFVPLGAAIFFDALLFAAVFFGEVFFATRGFGATFFEADFTAAPFEAFFAVRFFVPVFLAAVDPALRVGLRIRPLPTSVAPSRMRFARLDLTLTFP